MGAESRSLSVASLVGRRVATSEGTRLGRLQDVVVGFDEPRAPIVRGVIVRSGRRAGFIAVSDLSRLDVDGIVVGPGLAPPPEFSCRPGEFLVYEELVDHQVVDVRSARVLRVNDAVIADGEDGWRLIGVDVGVRGLLRRLAPRRLHARLSGPLLEWDGLDVLTPELGEGESPLRHARLSAMHPVDIGRVIDRLPPRQGAQLVTALEDALAADAIEEVEASRRASIMEYLPDERAPRILDAMAPDAAADVLEDLPRHATDHLLGRMDKDAAAKVRLLLTYAENSAGGLMTTEFVVALSGETTREAVEYVRAQLRKPDLIYYVYVVDDPDNQRLLGVVSLRDLLLAAPEQPLTAYMRRDVRSVHPEAPAAEAAHLMREYNLLALPVVDGSRRMLGLITADDVLDVLLPQSLRRNVPRLFS